METLLQPLFYDPDCAICTIQHISKGSLLFFVILISNGESMHLNLNIFSSTFCGYSHQCTQTDKTKYYRIAISSQKLGLRHSKLCPDMQTSQVCTPLNLEAGISQRVPWRDEKEKVYTSVTQNYFYYYFTIFKIFSCEILDTFSSTGL